MSYVAERERIVREYRAQVVTEDDRLRARVSELERLLAQRDEEIAALVAEAARRVDR